MFIALLRFILTMQINTIDYLIEIIVVIERYLCIQINRKIFKQILYSQIDLTNFHSIRVLSQLFIHDDLFGQYIS